MEELIPHKVYDARLGSRKNPIVRGIYLGQNNRQKRFLVRAEGRDYGNTQGTPRVYHFQRHEFDNGVLVIRYPRIAGRLKSS